MLVLTSLFTHLNYRFCYVNVCSDIPFLVFTFILSFHFHTYPNYLRIFFSGFVITDPGPQPGPDPGPQPGPDPGPGPTPGNDKK